MIRTRTIEAADGEPVTIEIDDGLPEPKAEPVDVVQAGLLIQHILTSKEEITDMPVRARQRKKKKVGEK